MKRILVLAFLLATGLGHSLFAEGIDTSSARTAWSRMLRARGLEKTSIGTIAVTETSSAVPLKATYVHSDSRGWWILWDHRPTPLGAVLEVYDTKARLAADSIADKGEFVAASPSKFDLRGVPCTHLKGNTMSLRLPGNRRNPRRPGNFRRTPTSTTCRKKCPRTASIRASGFPRQTARSKRH